MDEIRSIISAVVDAEPDAALAVKKAIAKVRKLDTFSEFVDELVDGCIRGMVYDERHIRNTRLQSQSNAARCVPKVNVGKSKSIQQHCDYYGWNIAGTTLGRLTGKQLLPIAEDEEAKSKSHQFAAKLLRTLAERVPEDATVKEAVNPAELSLIWNSIDRGDGGLSLAGN